ncbi:MAG: SAVED domain-containing protein [Gemmatales bacterium]|nr:SAVED domain-containing protein [Gemmatales bacterium]MCS7159715.1 SAVED domain-containing protein [Gemmatales bacterium]MDW8174913.1 SAVED domain-containing protein [Gemmatales bacterium]MDW8222811.1 SAVED domain-containing protein [Gemmatales bacterium]
MWDWLLRALLSGGLSAVGAFLVGTLLSWAVQEYRIRKIRGQLAQIRRERGAEVVLIISNREDIRPVVQTHLEKTGLGHLHIYQIHRAESFPTEEKEWVAFLERVKREIANIRRESSPARILLFTNVPVALGIFLGAILDNGPEVVVHHYFNGVYRAIGYLSHETIKVCE